MNELMNLGYEFKVKQKVKATDHLKSKAYCSVRLELDWILVQNYLSFWT